MIIIYAEIYLTNIKSLQKQNLGKKSQNPGKKIILYVPLISLCFIIVQKKSKHINKYKKKERKKENREITQNIA